MIVDALVQRVDDNGTRDVFLREWLYEEVLELRDERGVSKGWVLLDGPDDAISEAGAPVCKLVRKGREDVFEFPSVKVVEFRR